VLTALAAEVATGELVKLVIDQREKLVHSILLALADFTQQARDFPRIAHSVSSERDYSAGAEAGMT
jgi:hypothetical protein